MSQGKNWVFTLNNYTEQDVTTVSGWVSGGVPATYVLFSKEIGSGTPHLQGYAQFSQNMRLKALKKIQERAHWEVALGSLEDQHVYIKKEEGAQVFEFGIAKSVKRAAKDRSERYRIAMDLARSGDVLAVEPSIQLLHYNTLKKMRFDALLDRTLSDIEGFDNYWYWGEAGSGKSRRAREAGNYFCLNPDGWWDGYNDEENVIIDDLDPSHFKLIRDIKIWSDRYPFRAPVKGGYIKVRPRRIIITSNFKPEEVFTQKDLGPLDRRFNIVNV